MKNYAKILEKYNTIKNSGDGEDSTDKEGKLSDMLLIIISGKKKKKKKGKVEEEPLKKKKRKKKKPIIEEDMDEELEE